MMHDVPTRLAPPFWRHDAYTLRRLVNAVSAAARTLLPSGYHLHTACVVDLGAGSSPYRSLFEKRGARYIPCDIDVPMSGDIVPMESGKPVPLQDGSAHVVASFQVLEHVWDIDWYLGEAYRLLRTDGDLLLSTHGTWLYHPHPTDFRRWTRDGLVREIESRGFTVKSVVPLVGPLAWTTQFRTLGYHAILARIPVIGPVISALLCACMYLRMRVEDALTPPEWIAANAAVYVVTARKTLSTATGGDE